MEQNLTLASFHLPPNLDSTLPPILSPSLYITLHLIPQGPNPTYSLIHSTSPHATLPALSVACTKCFKSCHPYPRAPSAVPPATDPKISLLLRRILALSILPARFANAASPANVDLKRLLLVGIRAESVFVEGSSCFCPRHRLQVQSGDWVRIRIRGSIVAGAGGLPLPEFEALVRFERRARIVAVTQFPSIQLKVLCRWHNLSSV